MERASTSATTGSDAAPAWIGAAVLAAITVLALAVRLLAVTSRQVVYVASSGWTDYAACFLGAGFSAFGSSSTSSRLMVM